MSEQRLPMWAAKYVVAVAEAIKAVPMPDDVLVYVTGVSFGCEGEDLDVRLTPDDFEGYELTFAPALDAEATPVTAPAGSEDAGLVLSAGPRTEVNRVARLLMAEWERVEKPVTPSYVATFADLARAVVADQADRVEAARAEERERIAAAIDEAPGFRRWIDDSRVVDKDVAIHIARTPPPAGDAQGSQEASNGPVSDGDAVDGRGHGRDDESDRGADS